MTTLFTPVRPPSVNGAREQDAWRVIRMNFGDGYSQRAEDGINNENNVWELTWENLTADEATDIVTFLKSKRGVESFYWIPPREGVQSRWLCTGLSRTIIDLERDTVTATFERVFDLELVSQ